MSRARDLANGITTLAPLASPTFTGDSVFDTDTLKVDATNNRVGIGTASPANDVEIGAYSGDKTLCLTSSANGNTFIRMNDGDSSEGMFIKTIGGANPAATSMNFGVNWGGDTTKVTIDGAGNLIHNGLVTYTHTFAQGLSTTTNFDVTVPDSAQMFLLNVWHGYYPGSSYYANIFGVYAYRSSDTALGQLKDYFSNSHSNSGSFSVSITSGTNIRVTKTGGTAGSYARGCIQLIFNES